MPKRMKLPPADAVIDFANKHQTLEFEQKSDKVKWENWIPSAKMAGMISRKTPLNEDERYEDYKLASESQRRRKHSMKPANLRYKDMSNLEHQLIRDGMDKKEYTPKSVNYEERCKKQVEGYKVVGDHQTGYVPGRKIPYKTLEPRPRREPSVRKTTYYSENNQPIDDNGAINSQDEEKTDKAEEEGADGASAAKRPREDEDLEDDLQCPVSSLEDYLSAT